MIVDHINNYYQYHGKNARLDQAIEYIKNTDFKHISTGIHIIEGDELYFNFIEYETKTEEERFWESHKQYIDLHYLIEGEEFVGYEIFDRMGIKQEYDEKDDYYLLDGTVQSKVKLQKGDFMICFPKDVHMTGIMISNPEKVRKIVFKVKI